MNPISEVLKEWVNKRQDYINQHKNNHKYHRSEDILNVSDNEDEIDNRKPRLEQFLCEFEKSIKQVNTVYK